MKSTLTLELEIDHVWEETIPSDEQKKQGARWRQCGRCKGLRFGLLTHTYGTVENQSSIPLVVCMTCHNLMMVQ
jgi:hypothetical protein